MKTVLICPAVRPAVSQLSEAGPLAIAPMFGECLVNFWIEHVAALGARHVIIIASDRAERVRAAVGDGRRWGVQIEFVAAHAEPEAAEAATRHRPEGETGWLAAPYDIVVMNHLPELNALPLFDSYASWFAALQAWIPRALTPSRVRVSEVQPNVWVGSGARIAPSAKLQGPCWIGDHVTIEAGAVVGPNAILEDRAVVDAGATIANSVVGPDTFVGRMMSVGQSLASGSLLVNWRTESVLRVPDPFLMCSLVDMPSLMPDNSVTRAAASLARIATKPLNVVTALFSGPNRADGAKLSR
jgi:NDP-sugar pyrophosphorylase family protein